MSTVEPHDQPNDGALTGHREGTEPVRECRWAFEPVAARPRETDRHIGRVVQIDAWIGTAAERDDASQDLTGPAVPTRTPGVEDDPRPRARRAEPARALGQDAARVAAEPAGGLRQRGSAGTSRTQCEDERAHPQDAHLRHTSEHPR